MVSSGVWSLMNSVTVWRADSSDDFVRFVIRPQACTNSGPNCYCIVTAKTMPDYIPSKDDEFPNWQLNMLNYVNAHLAAFGLVAADTTSLGPIQGAWTGAL